MFAMRKLVLPENRYYAEYYLRKVWQVAYELCRSLRWPEDLPDWLEAKFQNYVTLEEQRIHQNLQDIHYDIDALDTVYIVLGPGRIEKASSALSLVIVLQPSNFLLTEHLYVTLSPPEEGP